MLKIQMVGLMIVNRLSSCICMYMYEYVSLLPMDIVEMRQQLMQCVALLCAYNYMYYAYMYRSTFAC